MVVVDCYSQARAIGIDWMVWHYVYTTEFLYKKLHPRETAKTITIFDVEGEGWWWRW